MDSNIKIIRNAENQFSTRHGMYPTVSYCAMPVSVIPVSNIPRNLEDIPMFCQQTEGRLDNIHMNLINSDRVT